MTLNKIRQRIKRRRVPEASRSVRWKAEVRAHYPNSTFSFRTPMTTAYELQMARAAEPSLVDAFFPEVAA
jgi:hypothetical protein